MMFFVYIIESVKTGRYYIGQTDNLSGRIERHNSGQNRSTKSFLPWRLKWWKEFETRSEAMVIEKKLKSLKKRTGLERTILELNFHSEDSLENKASDYN